MKRNGTPVFYLSGPITGTDDYIERFGAAEEALTRKGYTVINPAKVNSQLPEAAEYKDYMAVSFTLLRMADALVTLPGSEFSRGAKYETDYAKLLGIAIIPMETIEDFGPAGQEES